MNSQPLSPQDGLSNQTEHIAGRVVLTVKSLGHVPSVKNGKQLFLMNKRNRTWMQKCTEHFALQLLSLCRMNGGGTVTEHSLRSVIASLPADDNWKVISEESVKAVRVAKGNEGAHILIERIP